MKGYSTKYVLTEGIQEVNVVDLKEGEDSEYRYVKLGPQLKTGVTFFETIDEAEENAKQQAVKKVKGLKKRLVEVKKLVSKPKWGRPV